MGRRRRRCSKARARFNLWNHTWPGSGVDTLDIPVEPAWHREARISCADAGRRCTREHADKTELNGLSGRAFTVLNTLEVVQQYGAEVRYGDILIGAPGDHLRVLRESPFCICAKILSLPAGRERLSPSRCLLMLPLICRLGHMAIVVRCTLRSSIVVALVRCRPMAGRAWPGNPAVRWRIAGREAVRHGLVLLVHHHRASTKSAPASRMIASASPRFSVLAVRTDSTSVPLAALRSRLACSSWLAAVLRA
jgi:hypothetical protein